MTTLPALPFLPDAVVFDMDGLMIDSERVSVACWSQAAEEFGLALERSFFLGMVGFGDRDCRAMLRHHLRDEALIDAMSERCHLLYDERTRAGLPLRPGIVELLELLKTHDIPRAVATSTRQPRADHKLEAAGLLPYFHAVVTSSDVSQPKPAPEIYLLAAQRLGHAPARCLALEDSPAGIRAALGAGMTAIQVPDLVHPDDTVRALGHRIAGSLHDVRQLLLPMLNNAEIAAL